MAVRFKTLAQRRASWMKSSACISSREETNTSRRASRGARRKMALRAVIEVRPIWRDFSMIFKGERSRTQRDWKGTQYFCGRGMGCDYRLIGGSALPGFAREFRG